MFIFDYEEFFTKADWVSISLQFIFAALLTAYIVFILYFTVFKSGLWRSRVLGVQLEKQKSKIKSAQNSAFEQRMSNSSLDQKNQIKDL